MAEKAANTTAATPPAIVATCLADKTGPLAGEQTDVGIPRSCIRSQGVKGLDETSYAHMRGHGGVHGKRGYHGVLLLRVPIIVARRCERFEKGRHVGYASIRVKEPT
jgi:hypothetical protein